MSKSILQYLSEDDKDPSFLDRIIKFATPGSAAEASDKPGKTYTQKHPMANPVWDKKPESAGSQLLTQLVRSPTK